LGVITITRVCFERSCSNKKTPRYYANLSFSTLRTRRTTLGRAPAYYTASEASSRRRCGHASPLLWYGWAGVGRRRTIGRQQTQSPEENTGERADTLSSSYNHIFQPVFFSFLLEIQAHLPTFVFHRFLSGSGGDAESAMSKRRPVEEVRRIYIYRVNS